MSITSLKKYLYNDEGELRRIMLTMMKGLATSAVVTNQSEYDALQAEVKRIQAGIEGDFSADSLLVASGATVQALEAYNQRTTRFVQRQGTELQKIIKMLAESVIAIAGSSERSMRSLEEIRSNLSQTTALEDLQAIKARLGICLDQVCQESRQRQEEAATSIAALQMNVQRAAQLSAQSENDPITSLPGRCAAEAAFLTALTKPGRKYVGILVLDRLQTVNTRFGTAVGDQVLAEFARQLQHDLPPSDSLYRWSGPTLVALLQRQCPIDRIRSEMKPAFERQVQSEIDIGHRSVLIPIAPAWSILGLVPPMAAAMKHIDAVVSNHINHDLS